METEGLSNMRMRNERNGSAMIETQLQFLMSLKAHSKLNTFVSKPNCLFIPLKTFKVNTL